MKKCYSSCGKPIQLVPKSHVLGCAHIHHHSRVTRGSRVIPDLTQSKTRKKSLMLTRARCWQREEDKVRSRKSQKLNSPDLPLAITVGFGSVSTQSPRGNIVLNDIWAWCGKAPTAEKGTWSRTKVNSRNICTYSWPGLTYVDDSLIAATEKFSEWAHN